LSALRRDLRTIKATIADHSAAIDALNKECATNLRRCAELQVEIDHFRKKLAL
jgi:hypothetical protein